jgi:hypothetical protein
LENLYNKDQRAEIEKHFAASYSRICDEIDECVAKMIAIIKVVSPEILLHRAYWNLLNLHLGQGPEESNVEHKHLIARRLLDYGQSLIAAVAEDSVEVITDDQFAELEEAADKMFGLLNPYYFVARTAVEKQKSTYDCKVDEFITLGQMHYSTVRGNRYLVHDVIHMRDLLCEQATNITEVYGISASELLEGFEKLLKSITLGIQEAVEDLEAFRADTLSALDRADPAESERVGFFDAVLSEVDDPDEWLSRRNRIGGRLFGADLFDVAKVTNWPQTLIQDLSLRPGEDSAFIAPGKNNGWPTRFSQVRFKPLLLSNGAAYCFDVYGLADNFYRAIKRAVLRRRPDLDDAWRKTQQNATEKLSLDLLKQLMPGATTYQNVHYRVPTGVQQHRNWAECDGILIFDRHLFVLEVRSGAYVQTSPEADVENQFRSLANILLKPISQTGRLINELEATGVLELCDGEHRPLATIHREDFDEITPCCVTLDQLEHIASHIEDLSHLSTEIHKRPFWCISIDDLRVHADIFDNPLIFLDFLAERKRAQPAERLQMHDECDHLGAYLYHNRYVTRAAKITESSPKASVSFCHGYRDELDRYYSALWCGEPAALPRQEMPRHIRQIVDAIAQTNRPQRAAAVERLLRLDGDARDKLSKAIDDSLRTQLQLGRQRPISMFGALRLTVFCDMKPSLITVFENVVSHALAVMKLDNAHEWTVFQLQFSAEGLLEDVHWKLLGQEDLGTIDPVKLSWLCEEITRTRQGKPLRKLRLR